MEWGIEKASLFVCVYPPGLADILPTLEANTNRQACHATGMEILPAAAEKGWVRDYR